MKLNKQQTETTKQALIVCSKILLETMEISNIPNFVESTIVDEKTGVRYKIKFEKV
jgi:hypothetical protein